MAICIAADLDRVGVGVESEGGVKSTIGDHFYVCGIAAVARHDRYRLRPAKRYAEGAPNALLILPSVSICHAFAIRLCTIFRCSVPILRQSHEGARVRSARKLSTRRTQGFVASFLREHRSGLLVASVQSSFRMTRLTEDICNSRRSHSVAIRVGGSGHVLVCLGVVQQLRRLPVNHILGGANEF